MKIFDYTKWEVLETYSHDGVVRCVQIRMNKRTGLKHFKVTTITPIWGWCPVVFNVDKINKLTTTSP